MASSLVGSRLSALRLAIVATRHGGGPARTTRLLRTSGAGVLDDRLRVLGEDVRDRIHDEAESLAGQGVSAVVLGTAGYPSLLAALPSPPPALFLRGAQALLHEPSVSVCGSRDAGEEGLRAAAACAELATEHSLVAVSGYARGVDMAAHTPALRHHGRTIVVVPEGIGRFRVKRGEFAEVYDPDRVLVVSQFSPTQPWSASNAMARNAVIFGLSRALIVVEARDSGGTLDAGTKALAAGRRVVALDGTPVAAGNALLIDQGADRAGSRAELGAYLSRLGGIGEGGQLGLPL